MFDLESGGEASREAGSAACQSAAHGVRYLILPLALILAACAAAPPSPTPPSAAPTTIPPSATAMVAPTATGVPPSASPTRVAQVELRGVTGIIDGDSFWAAEGPRTWSVRAVGVAAPEAGDQRQSAECFAREAAAKAKELLLGKQVKLRADPAEGGWKTSGGLVRYVELPDGTDFGLWMIRNGYAHERGEATPYQREAEYKAAYAEAKERAVGFWSPTTCNGITKRPTATATPRPARPTAGPGTIASPTAKPRT